MGPEYLRKLNRLCKWRLVFASRWLGTRGAADPECVAVRDVFDKLLILRVEVTALTGILVDAGIVPLHELQRRIAVECDHLNAALERQFPGFTASDEGMTLDPTAIETSKNWPP